MTLTRILDLGSDPADESDLRVRKRAAVASALVFMTVAVVLGLADLALGQPIEAGLAFIQLVAFGLALRLFARTHRLVPLVAIMSVVGLSVLFVSVVSGGGLTTRGTNLVWTGLIPLGAVLFVGPRAALPALASVTLVVLLAVVVDPSVRGAPSEPSSPPLVVIALNILVPAAIALGLVVFIDGERLRAKADSDALLLNVLPRAIAERLKRGERVIADHHDSVTVLFADVVDFTPFASRESPARVVAVLNDVFSTFDTLAERYGLEKIKTIGDAYMVVAGVPEARSDHAAVILDMALAMHAAVESIEPSAGHSLQLRIGIASGPAVAGVIGHRKFSYDIWGGTVNLASRMETTGVPGMIQVADSTWRLCGERYPFSSREVDVKGIGATRTHLLDPRSVAPHGELTPDADRPDRP